MFIDWYDETIRYIEEATQIKNERLPMLKEELLGLKLKRNDKI
jgi:hypothetical protein